MGGGPVDVDWMRFSRLQTGLRVDFLDFQEITNRFACSLLGRKPLRRSLDWNRLYARQFKTHRYRLDDTPDEYGVSYK